MPDIEKEAQARFECASKILTTAQEEIKKLGLYFAAALHEHPSQPGIYHALIVLRDLPPEPASEAKQPEKAQDGQESAEDTAKRTSEAPKTQLLCPHGTNLTDVGSSCVKCIEEQKAQDAKDEKEAAAA